MIRICKVFLLLVCLGATISCSNSQNLKLEKNVVETLNKYAQCLMDADSELIKEITDEKFRLGVYDEPIASYMFDAFLKSVEAADSVYWGELQKDGSHFFCDVFYVYGAKEVHSQVTFSDKGKLLLSDWLDKKGFNLDRKEPSVLVASIPFEVREDKIFIKARLNDTDRELNMIFDTGADGMALLTSLQDECGVKITRSQTTSVPGGQMQVNLSEGNNLVLDSLVIPRQNLVLFETIAKGVDGIIGGSNFFRQYITEMDFDNHVIRLYKHGAFTAPEKYKSSFMKYATGVPTVPFHIYKDDHVFESEFIFDTGAGYEAILFGSGMKELQEDSIMQRIPARYYSYNQSVGYKSKIAIGQVDSITFTNMCFKDVYFAMEPYNESSHGRHQVMGSIGIKSLIKFNWIIDLTAYKVYSAPNKRTHLAENFVLDSHLIGYVREQLRVLRPVDEQKDCQLHSGDFILSINGVEAQELTTDRLADMLQGEKVELLIFSVEDKMKKNVVLMQ